VPWGECAGREVLTVGNTHVRLALADAGKRRLCLDFSRAGAPPAVTKSFTGHSRMSKPPGSRCLLPSWPEGRQNKELRSSYPR